MNRRQVIVVLGMHRSGTSAVTRGVMDLGVELGNNLMPPVPGENDTGYWEDIDISALNDEVLTAIGCSWESLRLIDPGELRGERMDPLRLRAARLLTEKFSGCGLFGFKDPRTCRLLPFWQQVFGDLKLDDRYVIVLRNPLSVASSLAARDGFSPEKSHLLWLEHMVSAMAWTNSKTRIVIDYDLMLDDPARQMERVVPVLGLKDKTISRANLSGFTKDFLTEDLRHTRFDLKTLTGDPRLPELAQETYRCLFQVALDRISPQDRLNQKTLQGIERTLNSLAPVYDLLDREMRAYAQLRREISERDGQIANLNQAFTGREGQIADLNRAVAERDGQIVNLNYAITGRDGQIADLNRAVAERDGRVSSAVQALELTKLSLEGETLRVHNFKADLTRIGKKLREETARIDRIENSTFWRFTAWFRMVWRFLETRVLHRNLAFRLVPNSDIQPLGNRHGWQSVGNNPYFDLLPVDGIYPGGWVLVRSSLQRTDFSPPVKLYLGAGKGALVQSEISLPVTRRGTVLQIVIFPRPVKALRWAPMDGPGELSQESIVISEVGQIERRLRMLARIWRVRREYAPAVLEKRGVTWRRALDNLAVAYLAASELRGDHAALPGPVGQGPNT